MLLPMRAVLRLLFGLVMSAAIACALIPAQAAVPQMMKAGCCAMMTTDAPANDCGQHAPSDQEKECCVACGSCAAVLFPATTPFVYPPTGEESFVTLSLREHVRPHRPPVPPPRP